MKIKNKHMKLKPAIRLILTFSGMILLAAGAIIFLGFTGYQQAEKACGRVQISISYESPDTLLTLADIDSLIRKSSGKVVGKELWRINTHLIEKTLKQQPWVSNAEVYETHSGTLLINIRQCKPVLRVISYSNRSFYLGSQGEILPVRAGSPARVPVASGFIPDSSRFGFMPFTNKLMLDTLGCNTVLSDLFRLAGYIDSDAFFRAQIDQIYITTENEIELIPKIGNHIIILGDVSDLDEKFHRLYAFYRYGMNHIRWNSYRILNIKYRNQVVCSKSERI
jgi:cell division protein FtsQ